MEWNDCSENMPVTADRYFVWDGSRIGIDFYQPSGSDHFFDGWVTSSPTHWLPLDILPPAPPEQGEG